jgi:hypothetical protein
MKLLLYKKNLGFHLKALFNSFIILFNVSLQQTFPQNVHVYLECWVISIFLTIFLNEAP